MNQLYSNSLECNILGSGSRRDLFTPNNLISIGCNVPWTAVQYCCIIDNSALDFINTKNQDNHKFILLKHVFKYAEHKKMLNIIKKTEATIVASESNYYKFSSAHYAAVYMIHLNYKYLNIYGCNSWFDDADWYDSYTNQFMKKPQKILNNIGSLWNNGWKYLKDKYPNVCFNFI